MSANLPRTPIPMVVVGGYLGTGKTTLLNHLLTHANGLRVAVLVNDFGEINIDAALIRARSGDVIQLENGCVCCSIGDKLVQTLAAIGERAQRPDLLVIEASGVSDPRRIAQVGMLDPAFRLNAIVTTADVSQLQAHLADPLVGDMVRQQAASATVMVLTKCDLVEAAVAQEAARTLKAIAPTAAQWRAVDGAVPLSIFLDEPGVPRQATSAMRTREGRWSSSHGGLTSVHASITSFAYRTPRRFHKRALQQVLRDLPDGTLRAKGIVQVQERSTAQEFHVVGGSVKIADAGLITKESALVFIGCFAEGDEQRMRTRLNSALAQE